MRNPALDIMKAIGILLMIVGHNSTGILFNYIYSFHMPLFFIIAGYLWKEKEVLLSLKHDFERIMIPYICYLVIVSVGKYIVQGVSISAVLQDALMIVWGNLGRCEIFGHHILGVSSLWFLPAFYICKNVFNAIYRIWNKRNLTSKWAYIWMYIVLLICALLGTVIYNHLFPLPFALTTGMYALVFYSIGHLLKVWAKDISMLNGLVLWKKVLVVGVWLSLGWFVINNMAICSYQYFPLNYITGIAGTIACYYISNAITKYTNYISKGMAIIGQYTISILIISHFITDYAYLAKVDYDNHILFASIIIAISLCYVVVHYTITQRVFRLKI